MSDHDTLNIILNRMNHQDRTLDEIKSAQAQLNNKVETHIQLEAEVKPSIDELIGILRGSKFIGRFVFWLCSALGSAWLFLQWAKDHLHVTL